MDPRLSATAEEFDLLHYVRFFELSLDLFCLANPDGYFLRVNPNFSKVLGYTESELLTQPFLDFVHPEDISATQAAIARLEKGLNVIHFCNRYRNVRGEYRVFEWTAKEANHVIYAVARDLTDQIQLQEEMFNALNREQAILDRANVVVHVKGVDHRYQLVNRQFAELFQVDQNDVIGKTDEMLFPNETAARSIANDDEVVRTGESLVEEEQIPQEGGLHTYITVKFPLLNAQGAVTAVAGISTDITDRIKAAETEQELHLAQVFQRTLYPENALAIAGLEIAGTAFPVSAVCGDYFDYIPLGARQVAISLGDVAGHGYQAALQMVELRMCLRMLLRENATLQRTVEELNRVLCEDFTASPSFVSLFLVAFDCEQRTLRYVGAGHDAFIIKSNGEIVSLDSTGMVIGVRTDESYAEIERPGWDTGDVFVLFTDGFYEAVNAAEEAFGKERTLQCLVQQRHLSAAEMIAGLFEEVKRYVGQVPVHDDMTIVVIKAVG